MITPNLERHTDCSPKRALDIAHEGHIGMPKTKALVRTKVWFPGIDKSIETMIHECLPWQATTPEERREPLNMSELPEGPWQHVSMDFCGPLPTGEYLLVIVDEYSRYPVVEVVNSTSAKTVLPFVDKLFSMFGVPVSVKTYNGLSMGTILLTLQNTWDFDTCE